jgi:hypothetical protein
MSKALLDAAVALVIAGVHPLTMTDPAQGASCRSEYDPLNRCGGGGVLRRVLINSDCSAIGAAANDVWGSGVFCRRRHQPREASGAAIRAVRGHGLRSAVSALSAFPPNLELPL